MSKKILGHILEFSNPIISVVEITLSIIDREKIRQLSQNIQFVKDRIAAKTDIPNDIPVEGLFVYGTKEPKVQQNDYAEICFDYSELRLKKAWQKKDRPKYFESYIQKLIERELVPEKHYSLRNILWVASEIDLLLLTEEMTYYDFIRDFIDKYERQ